MKLLYLLLALLIYNDAFASLIINEILFDPIGNDVGSEWIELYNTSKDAVRLNRWQLAIRSVDKTYPLPNQEIPGQSFLVIRFSQGDNKFDFTDGFGTVYFPSDNAVLDNVREELALITSSAESDEMKDFIVYVNGDNPPYTPGKLHQNAVKANIWKNEYVVSARNTPGRASWTMTEGTSLARDKNSTDKNTPDDWYSFGSRYQLTPTPGYPNGSTAKIAVIPSGVVPKSNIKNNWTIMYYGAADNPDLEASIFRDITEMAALIPQSGIQWVFQIDGHSMISEYTLQNGNAKFDAGRVIVTDGKWVPRKDRTSGTWRSPIIHTNSLQADKILVEEDNHWLAEQNTGDIKVLLDYVNWATSKFPANHYALILAGEGRAWKNNPSKSNGFLADFTNKDAITIAELNQLKFSNLDIIVLDADLMAEASVIYQFRHKANYLVASQAPEGFNGIDYTTAFADIGNLAPNEFCQKLINNIRKSNDILTFAAFDLTKVDQLPVVLDKAFPSKAPLSCPPKKEELDFPTPYQIAESINHASLTARRMGGLKKSQVQVGTRLSQDEVLINQYAYEFTGKEFDKFLKPLRNAPNDPVWGDFDFIDLISFLQEASKANPLATFFTEASKEIQNSGMIVASYTSPDFQGCNGISLYLPLQYKREDALAEFSLLAPNSERNYFSTPELELPRTGQPPTPFEKLYAYSYNPQLNTILETTEQSSKFITISRNELFTVNSTAFIDGDIPKATDNQKFFLSEYNWDFGDGSTSFESAKEAIDSVLDGKTTHRFKDSGCFVIKSSTSDADGNSSFDITYVLVEDKATTLKESDQSGSKLGTTKQVVPIDSKPFELPKIPFFGLHIGARFLSPQSPSYVRNTFLVGKPRTGRIFVHDDLTNAHPYGLIILGETKHELEPTLGYEIAAGRPISTYLELEAFVNMMSFNETTTFQYLDFDDAASSPTDIKFAKITNETNILGFGLELKGHIWSTKPLQPYAIGGIYGRRATTKSVTLDISGMDLNLPKPANATYWGGRFGAGIRYVLKPSAIEFRIIDDFVSLETGSEVDPGTYLTKSINHLLSLSLGYAISW